MHIDAVTVTCLNTATVTRVDYITADPVFRCQDFGFEAQPGDVVIMCWAMGRPNNDFVAADNSRFVSLPYGYFHT